MKRKGHLKDQEGGKQPPGASLAPDQALRPAGGEPELKPHDAAVNQVAISQLPRLLDPLACDGHWRLCLGHQYKGVIFAPFDGEMPVPNAGLCHLQVHRPAPDHEWKTAQTRHGVSRAPIPTLKLNDHGWEVTRAGDPISADPQPTEVLLQPGPRHVD